MSCFQLITESLIERSESCHKHSQIKQKCRFNSVCSGAHVSRPSIVSLNKEKVTWRGAPRGDCWLRTTARLSQAPATLLTLFPSNVNWNSLKTANDRTFDHRFAFQRVKAGVQCARARNWWINREKSFNWIRERASQSSDKLLGKSCEGGNLWPRIRNTWSRCFFPRKSSSDRLNAN